MWWHLLVCKVKDNINNIILQYLERLERAVSGGEGLLPCGRKELLLPSAGFLLALSVLEQSQPFCSFTSSSSSLSSSSSPSVRCSSTCKTYIVGDYHYNNAHQMYYRESHICRSNNSKYIYIYIVYYTLS